jgi:transcriptional regulator with XRE-family HTH domain
MNQLKFIRQEKNLTQAMLSKISGVSVQYIAQIEQDAASGVSDFMKEKLAKALKTDIFEVFPEVNREINIYLLFSNFIGSFMKIEKEDEPFLRNLVSKLKEEDLPDFFRSGMDEEEVFREIRAKAKKYHIAIHNKFSK